MDDSSTFERGGGNGWQLLPVSKLPGEHFCFKEKKKVGHGDLSTHKIELSLTWHKAKKERAPLIIKLARQAAVKDSLIGRKQAFKPRAIVKLVGRENL